MRNTFRALKMRNFRIFFVGQGISLVGTWMQQIAMSWLVYRLTNSVFILGLAGFLSQIPMFIFGPLAGVLADRLDRRRILMFTQVLSMIQAFILAFLNIKGVIEVWHIFALGIFIGIINSLDAPARQSFVMDMVERKDFLGNAIALNSLMFNLTRLIGPSIAGVLIAIVGEGMCFFINGLSFVAVILSLMAMNINTARPTREGVGIIRELKEGAFYAFGFEPIRYILILISVISVMGMSYVVLMPVIAKDMLGGGPDTLGFLMASVGVGALIATIFLASQKKVLKLGNIIPLSSSVFALSIMMLSLSRTPWISSLVLAFAGFGFIVHMASNNTVLQTIVDDDKRGRVMGFYTIAFLGMAPFGSLFAGTIASKFGVTNTLIIGSSACIIASGIFAGRISKLKKMVRPIYEQLI